MPLGPERAPRGARGGGHPNGWRAWLRRHTLVWVAAVLVVGLSASLGAAACTASLDQRSAQDVLDRRAAVAATSLAVQVQRYEDAVAQMAAALTAQEDLTSADFADVTAPLQASPLAGASGATLVVPARTAAVPAVSRRWQASGASPFVPAGTLDKHLFVVHTTSLDGAPGLASGSDIATTSGMVATMLEARRTGTTAVSATFVLLKDRALPREARQQSFVLAAPVWAPWAGAPADRPFRGWLLLTTRARDLARGTLKDAGAGLINVTLTVRTMDGRAVEAASVRSGPDLAATVERRVPVTLGGGQPWTLTVQSTQQAGHLRAGSLGRVLAGGGSTLTVLLALLVWFLLSARRRAEAQVRAATAGLRSAEADARSQAALLDAVVSSIGDGVGVVDGTGRSLLHNDAARRLLGPADGVDDVEAWQEHFGLYLPDGTTPFPVEQMPLVRALRGHSTDDVDMVVRHPDRPEPRTVSVSARPLAESAGVHGGAVAVYRDVTQARALERQLAAQHRVQQRLLAALSQLGEGVVVSERGRIVFVNDAYARLTGYSSQELLSLDIPTLAPDEQARADFSAYAVQLSEQGRTAAPVATRVRRKDGRCVPVELTGISADNHGVVQRVGLVRDLSERVRAAADLADRAAELEQANSALVLARDAADAASAAKSEFVARMSHEIRTPLNGVLGLTALLCGTELTGEQRHLAETAARSGEALLEVINDILDFSKIEAGKLELEQVPSDLAELLHDVANLFAGAAAAQGLDLLVRCPVLPTVTTDPTRLRQILNNLLGNAVKFTASGSVSLTAVPGPDGLRVEVTDTGPGISAAAQQRLFAAFEQADSSTTRQYGGTGLGLTISRKLAELLGGTLVCTSGPGSGSTFTLTLPRVTAVPEPSPALAGCRVLLLVGTAPLRRHLSDELAGWGATVIAPADRSRLPEPGQVDAAVVDGRAPGALAQAAALAGRTRVVVLHDLGSRPGELPPAAVGLPLPVRLDHLHATLSGQPAALPAPRTPDDPVPLRSLRVLVADDNTVNQLVTSMMLTRLGHEGDVVGDGQAAVDAAQLSRYDVVLMDCQMPVLDGLEATRRLRRLPGTRDLPVLALTAGVTAEEREACLAAGMDGWLSKPVRLEELSAQLDLVAEHGRRAVQSA